MAVIPYFGAYARFSAPTKEQGMLLLGADCLVGCELNVVFEQNGGTEVAWLENAYGGRCGRLDAAGAGQVLLCRAKEWDLHVLLASVYGTAEEAAGIGYWGEVVLLAYPHTNASAFDPFVSGVAKLLADGVRPQVDLRQSSLEQIIETGGKWLPSGRVATLAVKDSALVKDHQNLNDRMIEKARARHPGCMAAGWAFIALLVLGVLWLLRGLLGL
ncbi:MAG: hypothetical protein IJ131_04760 [Eggerthellaceae bacterium]|nr:hypothetical protein [Eggerthellaceae bacterium]